MNAIADKAKYLLVTMLYSLYKSIFDKHSAANYTIFSIVYIRFSAVNSDLNDLGS